MRQEGDLHKIGTDYLTRSHGKRPEVSPDHFETPYENVGDIKQSKGSSRTDRNPRDNVQIGHG